MSRAAYFRRQADVCLRLSLISTTEEVSNRLIVMAQEYNAKAAAIEADASSPPGGHDAPFFTSPKVGKS